MKSLKSQLGFIGSLIGAGASLLGGVLANKGAKSAAQTSGQFNLEAAREAGRFNVEAAEKAGEFNLRAARELGQFNLDSVEATNAYNKKEAELNRHYQTVMSNTAHTRQMKDLKNAGINPILA